MVEFLIKGNPPITSEWIDLPNIAELLFLPMYLNADIEEVYRFGNSFIKETILKAPLLNDRKYVSATFMLQLVDNSTRTIKNQFGFKDEWHIDGDKSPFDEDMRSHLLLSECGCMTEFASDNNHIEVNEDIALEQFNLMINQKQNEIGLVGRKMEPNKFHTFTNYLHRTSEPSGLEFRYMIRFIESDRFKPTPLDDSYLKVSSAFVGLEAVKSIERTHNSIILYRR